MDAVERWSAIHRWAKEIGIVVKASTYWGDGEYTLETDGNTYRVIVANGKVTVKDDNYRMGY